MITITIIVSDLFEVATVIISITFIIANVIIVVALAIFSLYFLVTLNYSFPIFLVPIALFHYFLIALTIKVNFVPEEIEELLIEDFRKWDSTLFIRGKIYAFL